MQKNIFLTEHFLEKYAFENVVFLIEIFQIFTTLDLTTFVKYYFLQCK